MSNWSKLYNDIKWRNGSAPYLNAENLNENQSWIKELDSRTKELYARTDTADPGGIARDVYYDNGTSGIDADNVQDAIDRIGANVITLNTGDDLDNVIDVTKKYNWSVSTPPAHAPNTTNGFYLEVLFDGSATNPRRRQIAYVPGTHTRFERLKDYQGVWGAWVRTDISNLIVIETKTYNVTYDAGTIGTRCVSENVPLNKSGYTPIAITVVSVSDSSKFSVNLMVNPANGSGQIKCYRATSTAASNVTLTYAVTYLRN